MKTRDSESDEETAPVLPASENKVVARGAIESVTSETSTIDCHPIVLESADARSPTLRADILELSSEDVPVVRGEDEDDGEVTHLMPLALEPLVEDPGEKSPLADGETQPFPVPGDISGALETVPLSQAMVQQVLGLVDARAVARKAAHVQPPLPAAPAPHQVPEVQQHPSALEPPRRLGVEIAIAVFAFLVVAVPALYLVYLQLT